MPSVITAPAFTVDTDGAFNVETLPASTLDYLQERTGGRYVDVIRLGDIGTGLDLDCWVNDEGSYLFPLNVPVSAFVSHLLGTLYPVYGPVVLVCSNDDGETVPLPCDVVPALVQAFTEHDYLEQP